MTLSKFTDKTIVSKKEFRSVLSSVAEQGYAIDHGEDIDGINCIGAPILNEYGYPVAAIWISAPSGRLRSEDFIEKGLIVKAICCYYIRKIRLYLKDKAKIYIKKAVFLTAFFY